ncbi:MAG: SH3 domain-containing protein [Bryobacteraceae bacterium]|nr:SH3 domain-containing protein [Bryobacteraceae bacterium]
MLWLLLLAALDPVRLYPIDDRQRSEDFRRYTVKLERAVNKHDVKALRKLVDDKVIAGPRDKDEGWAVFNERWHPETADSPVWSVLTGLLDIGFEQMHPRIFVSPYYAWKFPRELDPREHLVVIRDVVPVRATASRDAPSVATVAFEVVRRLGAPPTGAFDWVHIRTFGGQEGYIAAQMVRSPITPRAEFALRDGSWKLVVLD